MKKLLLLALLLPVFGLAQDCGLKTEKDAFTQAPKLTTGFMSYGGGMKRFLLSVDATSSEIDFFFSLSPSGEGLCFDNNSPVTILFEGGRLKSNFRNTGSLNCEGLYHFNFRNVATTPSILQRMATKKILSFTFKTTAGAETVRTLTEAEQQALMEKVDCLVKEAKTIIKK